MATSSGKKLAHDVAEHLESCASCQESLRIQRLMRIEAATLVAHSSVPPVALVLWRAKLRRINQNVDRACRPVHLAQGFSFLAVVVYFLMSREAASPLVTGEAVALVAVAIITIGILAAWWDAKANWRRTVLQSGVAGLRRH